MSVQLIVFPQTYDGQHNILSYSTNEFIVNGNVFGTLNSSPSVDYSGSLPLAGSTAAAIIATQPATIPNAWYRFRGKSAGSASYGDQPTRTSSNLVLNGGNVSATNFTFSGVYQKMTNLIVGQSYEISIGYTPPSAAQSFLGFHVLDSNNLPVAFGSGELLPSGLITPSMPTSNPLVFTFTATTTEHTLFLFIDPFQPVGARYNETITSVSVTGNVVDKVYDGQVICDLYEEEDIPLTLSVDDFKNVAEKVQSYSKAFNLPGTKRNNQIFDNLFDITRTGQNSLAFNPYAKTQCTLKQDGFVLFEGYLRILDIQDKEGEISYNVNLYSEVIALADQLGERTFSSLDFTELEHDYDITNIQNSWNSSGTGITFTNSSTSGFRDANDTVKYPFVNWNNKISLDLSTNYPILENLETAFRPFIQIKYLIDRIFNQPGLEFGYTSNFFNTTDFKKLYMDFNWGAGNSPTSSNNLQNMTYLKTSATDYATASFSNLKLTNGLFASAVDYNLSTNKFTAPANNIQYNISYNYQIKVLINSQYSFRWLVTRAATSLTEVYNLVPLTSGVAGTTPVVYSGSVSVLLQIGDTLEAQFLSDTGSAIVQNFDPSGTATYTIPTASVTASKTTSNITSDVILQTLRGELGQWDFLKGIMTMFNLISIPDPSSPNNILIEPYNDIFLNNSNSTQLDWTDKIDISQIKLKPLTNLNKKTVFKFVEDDDDFAFMNYKRNAEQHLYGSQTFLATTTTNGLDSVLHGEEEIIAEPFAATVPRPLLDQFSNFVVPQVYSFNSDDQTSEGFDNSPRIMYNNGKVLINGGVTYTVNPQNGGALTLEDEFLQFSHLSTIPTTSASLDFHFGICQLILPISSPTTNNLFNTYWLPYFNELYNPDTRIMTIKINLTPGDIATFKFFDTVFIKNREFRINRIDYKPNDLSTVELILIP